MTTIASAVLFRSKSNIYIRAAVSTPMNVLKVVLFVLATEHTLLRIFLNIWRQLLLPRDLHDAAF